jgi:hypothetical protein
MYVITSYRNLIYVVQNPLSQLISVFPSENNNSTYNCQFNYFTEIYTFFSMYSFRIFENVTLVIQAIMNLFSSCI